MGASGTGCGHWLLLGGSGLALACAHRREKEVETWVRTLGTAGTGGPARLLLLHKEEVGTLTAQELQTSRYASAARWEGPAAAPPAAPPHWQSPLLLPLGSRLAWPQLAHGAPRSLRGDTAEQTRGLLQQARPDGSPSCRATSRARAREHQAVGTAIIAAAERWAGLEQGARLLPASCCGAQLSR